MTPHQWLGIVACLVLVAFVVFAFRQGQPVTSRDTHQTSEGDAGGWEGGGSAGGGADHAG